MSLFQNASLMGQAVAITGRLSIPRREAIALISYSNGDYRTMVSSMTTILVVGAIQSSAPDGLTKKLRKAEQINASDPGHILIVDQNAFYRLLDSG